MTADAFRLRTHASPARMQARPRRNVPAGLFVFAILLSAAPSLVRASEDAAGTQTDTSLAEPFVEQLGWRPRAWLYHNFLTDEECEHLKQKATPRLERSAVVDNASGKSVDSEIRTSSGMFFSRGEDEVVRRIEERLAAFAMVPVDHGEGIQVLRYERGQKYEAHYDYFHDTLNTQNGGQRVATVLMYLSDVEEGGETTFPSAVAKGGNRAASGELSACGRRGVAVKPRKGNALLFWSLSLDGNTDASSLHASCPVIAGTKWTATKWMRVGKITGV